MVLGLVVLRHSYSHFPQICVTFDRDFAVTPILTKWISMMMLYHKTIKIKMSRSNKNEKQRLTGQI